MREAPLVRRGISMNEPNFPSGPWIGFYTYRATPAQQHRMDLNLTFSNGGLRGDGDDDIGVFHIRGRYDAASGDCHWTKSYVGGHDVFYHGFREGKGIWGTWELEVHQHGGFHIWPLTAGATDARSESAERTEVADAVGREEIR